MSARRTCAQLGVCQGRDGCDCSAAGSTRRHQVDTGRLPPGGFHFAPGTIEGARPRRSLASAALDLTLRFAVFMVLCLVVLALVMTVDAVPVFPAGVVVGVLGALIFGAE